MTIGGINVPWLADRFVRERGNISDTSLPIDHALYVYKLPQARNKLFFFHHHSIPSLYFPLPTQSSQQLSPPTSLLAMHAIAIIISALGLAVAAPADSLVARQNIASVDRYAGPGCTGTICNKAGAGDLHAGCNVITDSCTASLHLNFAPEGCKVTIWTDTTCSSVSQFANVTDFSCYALGPPIRSISVIC